MKTAARLLDRGERVIKFSTKSKSWGNIDVLTDKAVYECKNIDPSRNVGIQTAYEWAEDVKKVVEKTGKEGVLVFPDDPAIRAKINGIKYYLKNNKYYSIRKVAYVSDSGIKIETI